MDLTVGYLKKVLNELDENIIIADLGMGNSKFSPFQNVKRLLILKDINGKEREGNTYLTINSLGSHFTGRGNQSDLEYQDIYFDDESF